MFSVHQGPFFPDPHIAPWEARGGGDRKKKKKEGQHESPLVPSSFPHMKSELPSPRAPDETATYLVYKNTRC